MNDERLERLERRLADVRAAVVEAGENGRRYNDLRQRLASRLLWILDAPLDEPAGPYFRQVER